MDVKKKTDALKLGVTKTKCKGIRKETYLCYIILKRKGYTIINAIVQQSLYDWIINHRKVVQSPILNDIIKVFIDGNP